VEKTCRAWKQPAWLCHHPGASTTAPVGGVGAIRRKRRGQTGTRPNLAIVTTAEVGGRRRGFLASLTALGRGRWRGTTTCVRNIVFYHTSLVDSGRTWGGGAPQSPPHAEVSNARDSGWLSIRGTRSPGREDCDHFFTRGLWRQPAHHRYWHYPAASPSVVDNLQPRLPAPTHLARSIRPTHEVGDRLSWERWAPMGGAGESRPVRNSELVIDHPNNQHQPV